MKTYIEKSNNISPLGASRNVPYPIKPSEEILKNSFNTTMHWYTKCFSIIIFFLATLSLLFILLRLFFAGEALIILILESAILSLVSYLAFSTVWHNKATENNYNKWNKYRIIIKYTLILHILGGIIVVGKMIWVYFANYSTDAQTLRPLSDIQIYMLFAITLVLVPIFGAFSSYLYLFQQDILMSNLDNKILIMEVPSTCGYSEFLRNILICLTIIDLLFGIFFCGLSTRRLPEILKNQGIILLFMGIVKIINSIVKLDIQTVISLYPNLMTILKYLDTLKLIIYTGFLSSVGICLFLFKDEGKMYDVPFLNADAQLLMPYIASAEALVSLFAGIFLRSYLNTVRNTLVLRGVQQIAVKAKSE